MQLFSADATMFSNKIYIFLPLKTWKNNPQKMLIVGPDPFFQYRELAQIQPKSQFLFHKNIPLRDFSMTLPKPGSVNIKN